MAVAFQRELAASDNPEQLRAKLEAELASARSPMGLMESFALHELIAPERLGSGSANGRIG